MNKEEIKYVKTENGYKVSMPLLTADELQKIDFNFNSIVDEYIKEFSNKRERTIEQRLIYDLQRENKQLKEENEDLKRTCELFSNSLWSGDLKRAEEKLRKAIEMFESDEHFEDGCYCGEIEKMLKGDINEFDSTFCG